MMLKINNLFFAFLLSGATARQLSEEPFLTYEPISDVTDHAAVDLDLAAIEGLLALGTDQGREAALAVYKDGAFSKSYAEVNLGAPLTVAVAKGAEVVGMTANKNEIRGMVFAKADAGAEMLQVQYKTNGIQESYMGCQVGANPEPNTVGCFAPEGELKVGAIGALNYKYDPLTANKNDRTLQGFSKHAQKKMYECTNCPYPTYDKFYKYYGQFDYGNQFVLAGFNKGQTGFTDGNMDFSKYGMDGTAEIIKKSIAFMNVWMYVNRELEDAVDDCSNDCAIDACNDDQVQAWDEGVAFYTGSVAKADGEGGQFLYTLAQKRCVNYGTCIEEGDNLGMAMVNSEIFKNFQEGKQNLQMGKCDETKENVKRITELMTVPLVQGAIRYAFIQDKQNTKTEKAEAEGAAFAAAVLPIVHACAPADAKLIYDNMKVGAGKSASFDVVKSAFERNYECMGINCAEVGGLVDTVSGGYFAGADPCVGGAATKAPSAAASSTTSASSASSVYGFSVVVAVVPFFLSLLW